MIYVDDLIDVFGLDAVRYFVIHEMPYENDGTITWELMTERVNSDLANTLGNLVNRTIGMSNKYFQGTVADKGVYDPAIDDDMKAVVTGAYEKVEKCMETLHAADALTEIFDVFKRLNKYIDETEPWILAKDPAKSDRLSTVLYNLCAGIITGASLLAPFLPGTADKISAQLGLKLRAFDTLGEFGAKGCSETKVTDAPEILFARLDKDEILAKAEEIQSRQRADFIEHQKAAFANLLKAGKMSKEEAEAALKALTGGSANESAGSDGNYIDIEAKPEISYDDFAAMQLQVGEIIECAEVPKSRKLLCSKVRVGSKIRQILSGIKSSYTPEQMVGKKVVVLVNLKPREIAGMMSEGMLLCAEDADGKLSLLTTDSDMPAGAEIG